jgi:hypothetical protein
MTFISGIILFLVGFGAGATIIWFLRQKKLMLPNPAEISLKQNLVIYLKGIGSESGYIFKIDRKQIWRITQII